MAESPHDNPIENLDRSTLTRIARSALNDSTTELIDWRHERLRGGGGGVNRISGRARLAGIRSAFVAPEEAVPNRTMDWDQSVKIELDEETFMKEWMIGREMTEKEILAYISKNPFK